MRSLIIAVGLMVCVASTTGRRAAAQPLSSLPAAFAEGGRHARPASMAGAFTALATGSDASVFNPGGAAFIRSLEAGFHYADALGLVGEGEAVLAVPLRQDRLGLVVALRSSGDDVLRETTGFATVGLKMGPVGVGGTVKARRATFGRNPMDPSTLVVFDPDEVATGMARQVAGEAYGVGIDLGVQFDLGRGVRLGALARDLFAPLVWRSGIVSSAQTHSYVEGVPPELVIGISTPASSVGMLAADIRPALDHDMSTILRVGTEWRLLDVFSVRGGMERFLDEHRAYNWTLGFGVDTPPVFGMRLAVDYAYVAGWLAPSRSISVILRTER